MHNNLYTNTMESYSQQQNITIWSSTVKGRRRRARGVEDRNIFAPSGMLSPSRDERDEDAVKEVPFTYLT